MSEPAAKQERLCDCLVVIALREEFQAFVRMVQCTRVPDDSLGEQHAFHFLDSSGATREARVLVLNDQGPDVAGRRTDRALAELAPTWVVSVGIAMAMHHDVGLADVVLGTEADAYEYRTKTHPTTVPTKLVADDFHWGGKSTPTDNWLVDSIIADERLPSEARLTELSERATSSADQGLMAQFDSNGISVNRTKLAPGPIASGPIVIDHTEFAAALRKRNRNFIAAETEAAAVLSACRDRKNQPRKFVVKGASDRGDGKKSQLDAATGGLVRLLAMTRATAVLLYALRRHMTWENPTPGEKLTESELSSKASLHKTIVSSFLKPPFVERGDDGVFDHQPFDRLFAPLVAAQNTNLQGSTFASVARQLSHGGSMLLSGPPGTGKSTFLRALYFYLFQEHQNDPNRPLPVYIDLHYYDELVYKGAYGFLHQAEQRFQDFLDQVGRVVDARLLFIVDGLDDHVKYQHSIAGMLRERMQTLPSSPLAVAGYSELTGSGGVAMQTVAPPPFLASPTSSLRFSPVTIGTRGADDFLRAFVSIDGRVDANRLVDRIRTLGIDQVDLFTVSLINHAERDPSLQGARDLAQLLYLYCKQFLAESRAEPEFASAASLAYRYAIKKEDFDESEIRGKATWRLLQQHATIRDYLTAEHIISRIGGTPHRPLREGELEHVYPFRVNRFARQILARNTETQSRVLKGIRDSYGGVGVRCKAHLSYLAGRIQNQELRGVARQLLTAKRDEFLDFHNRRLDNLNPDELLLLRTIYISLVHLGDRSASHEYIEGMVKHPTWDIVNRGFHLEYYGDIEYDPSLPMSHEDRLGDCGSTLDYLVAKLRRNARDRSYTMLDVEAFTLLSLVQHRHAAGRLAEEDRLRALELCGWLLETGVLRGRVLQRARLLSEHLDIARFRPGRVVRDLYRLKTRQRSGWALRGLGDVESVAEHTIGALILAELLLPEAGEGKGYSKREIVRMLICHDFAEAETGDIPRERKSEADRIREREEFQKMETSASYASLPGGAGLNARWQDFESRRSVNARIAADIDVLDNVFQLYLEKDRFERAEDFAAWLSNLRSQIETEHGQRVLTVIEEEFGSDVTPD